MRIKLQKNVAIPFSRCLVPHVAHSIPAIFPRRCKMQILFLALFSVAKIFVCRIFPATYFFACLHLQRKKPHGCNNKIIAKKVCTTLLIQVFLRNPKLNKFQRQKPAMDMYRFFCSPTSVPLRYAKKKWSHTIDENSLLPLRLWYFVSKKIHWFPKDFLRLRHSNYICPTFRHSAIVLNLIGLQFESRPASYTEFFPRALPTPLTASL